MWRRWVPYQILNGSPAGGAPVVSSKSKLVAQYRPVSNSEPQAVATCWPYRDPWQVWGAINRRLQFPARSSDPCTPKSPSILFTGIVGHWLVNHPFPFQFATFLPDLCLLFAVFWCVTSHWTDATTLLGEISDGRSPIVDRHLVTLWIMDYGARVLLMYASRIISKKYYHATWQTIGDGRTVDAGRSSDDRSSACSASSSSSSSLLEVHREEFR